MFVKILGIGDLFAALIGIVVIFSESLLPAIILLLVAKWLMIKGAIFVFAGNYVSFVDILCGLYFVLLAYGWGSTFFTVLVIIWVGQKGLASMI